MIYDASCGFMGIVFAMELAMFCSTFLCAAFVFRARVCAHVCACVCFLNWYCFCFLAETCFSRTKVALVQPLYRSYLGKRLCNWIQLQVTMLKL